MSKLHRIRSGLKSYGDSLQTIYSDERAQANGVMSAVLAVIAGAVTMGVGAMVLAKIQPSVVGTTTASNETITAIFGTAWDAFALLPIVLVVIAAVTIISAVMWLGGRN